MGSSGRRIAARRLTTCRARARRDFRRLAAATAAETLGARAAPINPIRFDSVRERAPAGRLQMGARRAKVAAGRWQVAVFAQPFASLQLAAPRTGERGLAACVLSAHFGRRRAKVGAALPILSDARARSAPPLCHWHLAAAAAAGVGRCCAPFGRPATLIERPASRPSSIGRYSFLRPLAAPVTRARELAGRATSARWAPSWGRIWRLPSRARWSLD